MIVPVGVVLPLLFGALVWAGVRNALLALAQSSIGGGLSSGTIEEINGSSLLIGVAAAVGLASVLRAISLQRKSESNG
jgi:hypothetical protein